MLEECDAACDLTTHVRPLCSCDMAFVSKSDNHCVIVSPCVSVGGLSSQVSFILEHLTIFEMA